MGQRRTTWWASVRPAKEKTSFDEQRLDVEDSSAFISRFSQETWDGLVESRKPSQIVCNLHEEVEGGVVNIDVRSCRLNALIEANVHPIPIFSPVDEFKEAVQGELADYTWVQLKDCRSPLGLLPYDGPRW